MSILFQCSFLLILHCYFLGRLIPSPSIPNKFVMDDGANDELVSEMDDTAQDATKDMETNLDHVCLCRNPSLGLMTKARACKVTGQEKKLGSHITCLQECKECEGMNLHTPK
jgi:hypothetical protein